MRRIMFAEGAHSDYQLAIRRLEFSDLLDRFCDYSPAYNIAHVVLDDRNLSDAYIQSAIVRIAEVRSEFKADHGVTDSDIDQVAAFLTFLLSVPEEFRDYDNNWRE